MNEITNEVVFLKNFVNNNDNCKGKAMKKNNN